MTPQEFQEIVTTIHDRHIGDQLPQLHDLEWSFQSVMEQAAEQSIEWDRGRT